VGQFFVTGSSEWRLTDGFDDRSGARNERRVTVRSE